MTARHRTPTSARSASACPGALPTINRQAVEHVITTGLAIEASVPAATRWDRKNYFYPDLPKGYQISQYDLPLASMGRLTFETSDGPFTVAITRAHLEEDTAKLVHGTDGTGGKVSLVDFNRSGAPLMEIVTEPDIRTAEQARRYAEELQLLMRAIGASDADMERGQMRVEANVSLRPARHRAVRDAGRGQEHELVPLGRAGDHLRDRAPGGPARRWRELVMETRGWSDERGETYRMRAKETSDDYRYFPEPDLPPLHLDPSWLAALAEALPELPAARRARYRDELGLSPYDARVLVADPDASAAVRGDARRWTGRRRRRRSRTWVAGEYLKLAEASGVDAGRRGPGAARGDRRGRRRPGRSRGPRAARCSMRTSRPGGRPRRSSRRAGSPRSPMPAPSRRSSTRSSPRTRQPSPTTAPARPRPSASSSARS